MAQPDVPALDLDYAFSMRIDSSGRLQLEEEMRTRVFEPATGGEVWGPKLQGRVVPQSGGDYAGNNLMDAHLMLQASDGTWIYMNLQGYEHTHTEDGSAYFRVTPYFDAPQGPWAWLARTVFVGTAQRQQQAAQTLIHFYQVL